MKDWRKAESFLALQRYRNEVALQEGEERMYYQTHFESPLGGITLASDGEHLSGVWLDGQKYFKSTIKEEMHQKEDLPVLEAAKEWLKLYFDGKRPDASTLTLSPAGSKFRQEVWKLLLEIPYGQVTTYGALAAKIAEKRNCASMSAQAIGGAVSHNPISIIIPCHRVIGTNGSLTGYAGGIEKKIRLLELEGVDVNRLTDRAGRFWIKEG